MTAGSESTGQGTQAHERDQAVAMPLYDSSHQERMLRHKPPYRGLGNSLLAPSLIEQLPHWAFLLLPMGQASIQLKGSFSVMSVMRLFVRTRECGPRI